MTAFTPGDRISREAAVDLRGYRYRAVKLDANERVVLATAGTDDIIGVLDNEPKAGETADIVLINGQGTFKTKASANIAKGALITATTEGKAVTATTTGHRVYGRAIRAGVTDEVIEYIKMNEKV